LIPSADLAEYNNGNQTLLKKTKGQKIL